MFFKFLAICFLLLLPVNSSNSDDPIKVYWPWKNSLCGKGPSRSLSNFSLDVSPIGHYLTCNNVNYCSKFTVFYPTQYYIEVSNKCGSDTENLVDGLIEQLGAISELIYSYPAGCFEILQKNKNSQSGYYTIQAPNNSLISVYCDMKGSNCDGKGGWMRVGYLNMTDPGSSCPSGLTLRQFNNIDHGLCGRPMSSSVTYSAHGFNYSKVCGQIRGYQFGFPDGFPPLQATNAIPNIDNCNTYVDGVTITYGSNPRKHIWTYACGVVETISGNNYLIPFTCPCSTDSNGTYAPEWVGSDYYCESGLHSSQSYHEVLFSNDTLWDGQQCNGSEGPCCTNPKMPWFIKTLNATTTEDIELRMCGSEDPSSDEDTPLDIIELYIR